MSTTVNTAPNPFARFDAATGNQYDSFIPKAATIPNDPASTAVTQAETPSGDNKEVTPRSAAVVVPAETKVEVPVETPKATEPVVEPESNDPYKKRYDDIRRSYDEKTKQINDLKQEIEDYKKKPDLSKLCSEEELEAFAKEAPDAYKVMETIAIKKSKDYSVEVERLKEEIKGLAVEKALSELQKIHPDAKQIKEDPRFVDWFSTQTNAVKALVNSSVINDVSLALDMYKKDAGITLTSVSKSKEERKEVKEKAAMAVDSTVTNPSGDAKKIWTPDEINTALRDSSSLPYNKFVALTKEIQAAQQEGRIASR